MGHNENKGRRVSIASGNGEIWQGRAIQSPVAKPRPLLLSNTTAVFLTRKERGIFRTRCTIMICGSVFLIITWRAQHVACQRYPIPLPWIHIPVATLAECLSPRQGSERYLVVFYDMLSAAAGQLFFTHPPARGFLCQIDSSYTETVKGLNFNQI